jgi:hypothetical protein
MEGLCLGRHDDARDIRREAADIAHDRPYTGNHKNNGEEDEYKDKDGNRNFIANFTKGLKHHEKTNRDAGEVENEDYRKLLEAIDSGKQKDFDDIPLGTPGVNGRKLGAPQSGYAYDLEGPDAQDIRQPKAPKISSREAAAEMAEVYWMALCRDIKFSDFDTDPLVAAAVTDLDSGGYELKVARPITTKNIFRGSTKGDDIGPYISQFLYKDIQWGSQKLHQTHRELTTRDYLTNYDNWLEIQDGKDPKQPDEYKIPDPLGFTNIRLIITPRDLCYYVHIDALYQAYLGAVLILLQGVGASTPYYHFDPLLPYQKDADKRKEFGFPLFGGPHILSLVTEVATRGLKAVWFQKWQVHRRLRPEAFGGLIHRQLHSSSATPTPGLTDPDPAYPIHDDILIKTGSNQVLERIRAKYSDHTYLLPQAFPEGSPMFPAYGAGHATVAGACTTILKAWFKEDDPIDNPQIPNPAKLAPSGDDLLKGDHLVPYTGADKDDMTVGGELNKVASNIAVGRNWAGVHYRSDYIESILLGEQIAIGILQEQAITYNEKFACTLTKFDGSRIEFDGSEINSI